MHGGIRFEEALEHLLFRIYRRPVVSRPGQASDANCKMPRSSSLWQGYVRSLSGVDRLVSKNLGRLGALVARNPIRSLCFPLLLAVALCAGWARIGDVLENEVSKLWYAPPCDMCALLSSLSGWTCVVRVCTCEVCPLCYQCSCRSVALQLCGATAVLR